MRSILDGLIPSNALSSAQSRRAFLFPILAGFRPGQPLYEKTVEPMRLASHVDIFGLTYPFGPLSEDRIAVYGPLIDFCGNPSRLDLEEIGAVRTRAWLDSVTDTYDRLVLLSHHPNKTLRHWTKAIGYHPIADRIRIIPMSMNQRPTDPYFRELFRTALDLDRSNRPSDPEEDDDEGLE